MMRVFLSYASEDRNLRTVAKGLAITGIVCAMA